MRDERPVEIACSSTPIRRPVACAPRAPNDLEDDPEIDEELPPHVGDDAAHRDRVEGPLGEPDVLHRDELVDDLGGMDAALSDDLPIGDAALVEDVRGEDLGDARGPEVAYDASDDLAHFEERSHEGDARGFDEEDHALDEDPRTSADDGGAEGTSEDIAAEVDEGALPELDADDGGTFDLGDLMRELRAEGLGHESSGEGWVVYEGWGALVPSAGVAIDRGRVVAAGAELCVIDPGDHAARRHGLPRRATAVAASPDGAVLGTPRGVLVATPSASASPAILSLLESERPVRALSVFAGRTWALVGDELWQLASPPAPPVLARSRVVALAAGPDALLSMSNEPSIARFRGDDGDWETLTLPKEADALFASREPPSLAVGGGALTFALASKSRVFVSRDGGARCATIELDDALDLVFAGASPSARLLALTRRGDRAAIVSIDERGRTSLEGEVDLGPLEIEGDLDARVRIAWDETREALFVATPRGLFAVGPKRTH